MSMFGPSVLQSVAGTPHAAQTSLREKRKGERRTRTEEASSPDHRVDHVELAEAVRAPEANDREEAKEDRQAHLPDRRSPSAPRTRLDIEG